MKKLNCILFLCLLVGCADTGEQQPSEVLTASTTAAKTEVGDAELAVNSNSAANESAIETADPASHETVPTEAEPPLETSKRRLVLFAGGAPLLIDFHFSQNRFAYDDIALDSAMLLLMDADQNDDGVTSWEEIAQAPLLRDQQNAMDLPRGNQRRLLFRSYDRNANEAVDPDELLDFFNRGQLASGWLTLMTTGISRDGSIRSAIGQWLDANHNKSLERIEIEQAYDRLLMRDADDNGLLALVEFSQPANVQYFEMMQQQVPANQIPGFVLDENSQWSELQYRLQNAYTYGAPLLAEDLETWPTAFQQLDEDGDGTIWDNELKSLLDAPADVSLSVSLGDSGFVAGASISPMADSAPTAELFTQSSDNHLVLTRESGDISFSFASGLYGGAGPNPLDAAFEQFDQNEDGLDEDEFSTISLLLQIDFAAADQNQDERVTREEIEAVMAPPDIIAALRLEMWLLPPRDALMDSLDANHDGLLNLRELEQATTKLLAMDTSGDEILQPDELEAGLHVIMRHLPSNRVQVPPAPQFTTRTTAPSSLPPWAAAMDINHDGQVAEVEFLGPAAKFQELDKDQDGTLVADELP